MVDTTLVDEAMNRSCDPDRVDAVELEAAWAFTGSEVGQLEGLLAALGEWPGGDHLADEQSRTELSAERPKGVVGHPGHRREDDG